MEDAAPGSPQRQATQEAEALRTKGNEFFRKGEFEQAKVAYSRGLILDPMNALLWSNRSATHLALDNPFFALYDAHQLYLLKPTWEKTLYRLGMANLRLPERAAAERARICFGSGLLLAPDSKDMKGGWMEASRLLLERKARPPFKIRDWVDAREMCKTEERMAECEARMKGVELYSVTPPERDITLAGNPKAKRFFDMLCMGRLVEVRDVEGAGRGLFARCDFKKGMLILQEEPVLACNIQETGCLRCFKPLRRKRLRCGGCQRCFCSPRCKSLSKEHRFLCAAKDQLSELLAWIKECSMSSSGKSHLLMAQAIAIAMQRELLLSPFEIEEIGHLKIGQHNGHPLRDSGHFVERLQQLFGISSLSWLNAEWHYYATQIIQNNAFTFTIGKHDPWVHIGGSGDAVYSLVSMVNHSCSPNASWHVDVQHFGNSMFLWAEQDIRQGEQIFISYIVDSDRVKIRTSRLYHYGFKCHCERCERDRAAQPEQQG